MARPRIAVAATGVHAQLAPAFLPRSADDELHLDRVLVSQYQRHLQRQLLQPATPHLLPARKAISTKADPGTTTRPSIT
ncbi:hypothetical protein SVIO_026480 [Streptomyces violaceusniger]|uniref:Uncharacterized protein n=1 Tax=Streptomyces violaceusniger TaxID=68280 RepID=A0A4D4KSW6_STRVO|nr:hypothetical protein SVIO_026480 [Streptomyces violaceusniger]